MMFWRSSVCNPGNVDPHGIGDIPSTNDKRRPMTNSRASEFAGEL
jgi:hypothetical protein